MGLLLSALTGIAGMFGLLWYRTLVRLPGSRRPHYVFSPLFKWGVPAGTLALLLSSLYSIGNNSTTILVVYSLGMVAAGALILYFDRYSAEMRLIYDRYRKISSANPTMEEIEVLFRTAAWRYPAWNQDRLLELVAGKDVETLLVLMMVHENGINPLADWHLYRKLKAQAARIAGTARESKEKRHSA